MKVLGSTWKRVRRVSCSLGGDGGWIEQAQGVGCDGGNGLRDDGDDEEIAVAEVGLVMVEGFDLLLELRVLRGGGEDEQDAIAIDE